MDRYTHPKSYQFLSTLFIARKQVPVVYVLVYGAGNVVLNVLNWYW